MPTNLVLTLIFVRNVAISLDEETARWARVEAARSHTGVSRWIGELLEERRRDSFDTSGRSIGLPRR